MGISLLIGILTTKVRSIRKMKTFIVFLGLLGAALSLPERGIDRNIFDDAWNGIQDTVNGVVSGARLAGLLANCNSPLRQMVSDFNADFIDDFKNMKDKGQVFPYFGNGLSNIGEEFGQLANNLDDLATCMKGSIFGRTYKPTSKLQLATTPSAANRFDILEMLRDALDLGKFGFSLAGKVFNCRGEISAVVGNSKIDEILHDLQPLLALDVTEFDQEDINGLATGFENASSNLKELKSKLKNLGTCVNK